MDLDHAFLIIQMYPLAVVTAFLLPLLYFIVMPCMVAFHLEKTIYWTAVFMMLSLVPHGFNVHALFGIRGDACLILVYIAAFLFKRSEKEYEQKWYQCAKRCAISTMDERIRLGRMYLSGDGCDSCSSIDDLAVSYTHLSSLT